MTAVRPAVLAGPAGATVVLAGGVLLLARPWLTAGGDDPTAVLLAVFVGIGLAGALWPLPRRAPAPAVPLPGAAGALVVTAAGVAVFAAGRLLGGGEAAAPALAGVVALNVVAAVAEEALFRRLLYGLLEPFGATVAVVGSAAAFAVVHVTVWGAWVLPIDLAAGLVLSWQRWAAGRWSVPAATHAVANVLAVV